MFEERRRKARANGFKVGSLVVADPLISFRCLVWGHTNLDALIEVESGTALPEVCVLVVPELAIQNLCRVVWSEERDHGIEFIL